MGESRDGLSRVLDCNGRQVKALGAPTDLADATYCTNNVGFIAAVGSANALGASLLAAPADHAHAGVHSLHADAGAQILGDAQLISGAGIVLVQSGSGITILNGVTGIVGAAGIVAGELLSWENSGGSPRLVAMDITDGVNLNLSNPVGFALASAAAAASAIVVKSGIIDIADALWDAVPAVTDVGLLVYASAAAPGHVTLAGANSANNVLPKVGLVARGGAGAARIDIQLDSLPPAVA